jgi:hypothetical protein
VNATGHRRHLNVLEHVARHSYGEPVADSAWTKWARAVEHQKILARAGREYTALDSYEYVRTDNCADATDPVIKMHWRLNIKIPYPERWSVLIGDVLTNLRAALDHIFWQTVIAHSGQPLKPHRVTFPIAPTETGFRKQANELSMLVAPDVWKVVEAVQPFHGGALAHTHPLEILRWLSNVDKHRAIHIVNRTAVDMGPIGVGSPTPIEILEDWRLTGTAEHGTVLARLKVRRPPQTQPLDVMPTFAHMASIQISDNPVEIRSLSSAIDDMHTYVLEVLAAITSELGIPFPDVDDLELGAENDVVLAELGGDHFRHSSGGADPDVTEP